ncbi:hypothetical protein [Kitasatospora sp. NPDC094015]|uniref:hypothetical protein n=1 Tax=Kitasatospora sp. NPDC094015 TaxID=3155205 RepID=UPI003323254C
MTGVPVAATRPADAAASEAVPALEAGWVVAGIEGVMSPRTFDGVRPAVQGLLDALRGLPLDVQHRQFLEGCLAGRGAFEYISWRLQRTGRFLLDVRLVHTDAGVARWVEHPLTLTAGKPEPSR